MSALGPVLVDTHTYLWAAADAPELSAAARGSLFASGRPVLVSLVSAWEMAIKASIGKLVLAEPLRELLRRGLRQKGWRLLPLELEHVLRVEHLPFHHRDPFDRLLVAQALEEGVPIVSADEALDAYGVQRVW